MHEKIPITEKEFQDKYFEKYKYFSFLIKGLYSFNYGGFTYIKENFLEYFKQKEK